MGLKTSSLSTHRFEDRPRTARRAWLDVADAADRWFQRRPGRVPAGRPDHRAARPLARRRALPAASSQCRSMSASAIPTSICMPATDHFTDFIARTMEKWEVPITLLHNYPFQREAARASPRCSKRRLLRCRRDPELHLHRYPCPTSSAKRWRWEILEIPLQQRRLRPERAAISARCSIAAACNRSWTAGCTRTSAEGRPS